MGNIMWTYLKNVTLNESITPESKGHGLYDLIYHILRKIVL